MKLISHRGNLFGSDPKKENSPDYVQEAISYGYDVEIDFRIENNKMFLGHDFSQYEIDEYFLYLNANRLWIHCKNLEALNFTLKTPKFYNAFWHESDQYTITTNNYIWTYPGIKPGPKSIIVCKEMPGNDILSLNIYGICSDYVGEINNVYRPNA